MKGLPADTGYQETASGLIELVDRWQAKFRKDLGVGLFTWRTSFVLAGRVFRNHGIMMITRSWRMVLGWPHVFWRNCRVCWRLTTIETPNEPTYVICGRSAESMFADVVRMLEPLGIELRIIPVTNHFFGGQVTVTGLLTGHDILRTRKVL